MDAATHFNTIVIVAGGLLLCLVTVAVWIRTGALRAFGSVVGVGRAAWSTAVRELSEEIGLEYEPLPEAFDRARGQIGGSDLSIEYDTMEGYEGIVMEIEVSTSGIDDALEIVAGRGEAPPFASDDLASKVKISGASKRLLAAIHGDPETRRLLIEMIGEQGAKVSGRDLKLLRPRFCETTAELRHLVSSLVSLSQRLARPDLPVERHPFGTPWALQIRRAERLREEARFQALKPFLEHVARSLEGGKAYRSGSDVELRAKTEGRDVRIELDSSLGIEITLRLERCPLSLWLYYDPEVEGTEEPPAWSGNSTVKGFLSKTVYVEGAASAIAERKDLFERMPASLRSDLLTQMPALGIRYLRFDDESLWVMLYPNLNELVDPEAHLRSCLALLSQAAAYADTLPKRTPGSFDVADDDDAAEDDDSDDSEDDDP